MFKNGLAFILIGFALLIASWAMGASPDTRWLSQTGVLFLFVGLIAEVLEFVRH